MTSMAPIELQKLDYIKNVTHQNGGWAYKDIPVGAYFPLNFHRIQGAETHVVKLPMGSLIVLSQRPDKSGERHLTHIVELVNDGNEDLKQQDPNSEWGLIRWVKVKWVVDFSNTQKIPLDQTVMQVEWGKYNSFAKSLDSEKLMEKWGSVVELRHQIQSQLKFKAV